MDSERPDRVWRPLAQAFPCRMSLTRACPKTANRKPADPEAAVGYRAWRLLPGSTTRSTIECWCPSSRWTGREVSAKPKYVILINWTEQGAQSITETTQRAEQVQQMVAQLGGRMDTLLWTQGRYDLVGIMEAPDEETAAAVGLRVGMKGAVRTETLRAFDAEEMGRILTKVS